MDSQSQSCSADDFAGLDPALLESAGVAPLATALRKRIPDVVRFNASADMFQLGALCFVGLILWGVLIAARTEDGVDGPGSYLAQILFTVLLLCGSFFLCRWRYLESHARHQQRWDTNYVRADYELRATGLSVIIVDLDVWQQILGTTEGSLLGQFFEHKLKGAEDCMLHACAYWGALHEYMLGSELVQPHSVWAGHQLRGILGNGSGAGQRYYTVEHYARLAAICDYFSADLEVMPPWQDWRELMALPPEQAVPPVPHVDILLP